MEVWLNLIIAAGLTILIEWLLSLIFFRNKNDRKIVVLAQLVTNPPMNLFLLYATGFSLSGSALGLLIIVLILELAVTGIEAVLYKNYMSGNDTKKKIAFAIFANMLSAVLGLAIIGVFA